MPTQTKNDPKAEYLCKPENFDLAYEVNELYPKILDRLLLQFWERLENEVQVVLKCHRGWTGSRDKGEPMAGEWYGLSISPYDTDSKKRHCCVRVEQHSNRTHFIYGVAWSEKIGRGTDIAQELGRSLSEHDFKQSEWWVGWQRMHELQRLELERIAQSDGTFEQSIASELGQLIDKYGSMIRDVNESTGALKD